MPGNTQLGDYYACARICGAPVPPPAVISRAVAFQVSSSCHRRSNRANLRSLPCNYIPVLPSHRGLCIESLALPHIGVAEPSSVALQGFSCVLTGLIGSGNATTACESSCHLALLLLQGMFAFPYLTCVCRANTILFLKCGRLPAYHDVPEWQPHRLKD